MHRRCPHRTRTRVGPSPASTRPARPPARRPPGVSSFGARPGPPGTCLQLRRPPGASRHAPLPARPAHGIRERADQMSQQSQVTILNDTAVVRLAATHEGLQTKGPKKEEKPRNTVMHDAETVHPRTMIGLRTGDLPCTRRFADL